MFNVVLGTATLGTQVSENEVYVQFMYYIHFLPVLPSQRQIYRQMDKWIKNQKRRFCNKESNWLENCNQDK